jgi:hypothetical protein
VASEEDPKCFFYLYLKPCNLRVLSSKRHVLLYTQKCVRQTERTRFGIHSRNPLNWHMWKLKVIIVCHVESSIYYRYIFRLRREGGRHEFLDDIVLNAILIRYNVYSLVYIYILFNNKKTYYNNNVAEFILNRNSCLDLLLWSLHLTHWDTNTAQMCKIMYLKVTIAKPFILSPTVHTTLL